MATAEELLAMTAGPENKTITADWDTRQIFIPTSIIVLGVEADDDTHRLYFKVPRHFGEFDLSKFKFQINYKNARNGDDVYPVDDLSVSTSDDTLTFSWLVDRFAYMYSGTVKFNICMKQYDADNVVVKELNTTIATLQVLEGLETDVAVVENNPSAFDQVLNRLFAVEAATGLGKDGYYSLIKTTENTDGVVFTIVDQDGTTTATVKHGKDAYTPVKGKDYWTDAERTDMLNQAATHAKNYVDTWAPSPKTITLSATSWENNSQTVTINGVTTTSIVIVSPEPSLENYTAYTDAQIRCVAQGTNTLTFECDGAPTVDVNVNVGVHYSK